MITFVVALGASAALTAVLVPVLARAGLQDVPNDRSSHQAPTPRGGGIAVVAALLLAVGTAVLLGGASAQYAVPVVASATTLAAVGLVDDLRGVAPAVRLALQASVSAVACVAVALGVGGGPWGAAWLVLVGTVASVAFVNAFNFMDGVNGISALNAAVYGCWFVWVGLHEDQQVLVVLGAALAGAALGFLPWNASSRVFLGDVGSYGIGAVVAGTAVLGWAGGGSAGLLVVPLTVYLADTGWVLVKKVARGQSLTQAHRDHVYQRLVARGWTHLASATWTAGLAGVACVAAVVLHDRAPGAAVAAACAVALVHLGVPRLAHLRPSSRAVTP